MKVVALRVLLVLELLCLGTLTEGQPKASLKCSKECGRFTATIPERRVKSYRRTEPQCFKQGIIFTTQKDMEMCADPAEDWVKKIIRKLDQKKASVTSPPSHAAPSAAVPEDPGSFHKQVGLRVTVPSQVTAPTSASQGHTSLDGRSAPTLKTEVSPEPTQDTLTVIWDVAAPSNTSSEASSDSSAATAPSTASATGTGPSQSTSPVQGFESLGGPIEEHKGHTANATAQAPDIASPVLNSDPGSTTKALDHSLGFTDGSLDPTSARANTSDAASRSFHSDLPSVLGNPEITTTPTTPFPEATSVSTLNPRAVTNEGHSDPPKKVCHSWVDAFDTRTPEHSSGKQNLPDTPTFTSQTSSGQARAWATTEKTKAPAFPSLLSRSQAYFVIPASLAGTMIACSAAALWLYKKFALKKAAVPMEMVQGLLYHQQRCHASVHAVQGI